MPNYNTNFKQDTKTTKTYTEPGRGRKFCEGCQQYIPNATRWCSWCGTTYDFGKLIKEKSDQDKEKLEIEKPIEIPKVISETDDLIIHIPSLEETYLKSERKNKIYIEFFIELDKKEIERLCKKFKIKLEDNEENFRPWRRKYLIEINDYVLRDQIKSFLLINKIDFSSINDEARYEKIIDPISVNPDKLVEDIIKKFPFIKNIFWNWKENDVHYMEKT